VETIIVILIIGAAAIYCLRNFTKKLKRVDDCHCVCSCETGGPYGDASGCRECGAHNEPDEK